MTRRDKLTPMQKQTLLICFLGYSAAYTGRLNLSAALPEICSAMELNAARAGIFQTVFAVIYAAGQIINGSRADRISPRRNIALGLFLSAACNLCLGLAGSFELMLLLWALNGAAQSMLWTPIVRLTAQRFDGAARDFASFALSVSIVLGHFAAWALAGVLAAAMNWRFSFFVPALIMLAAGAAAFIVLRDDTRSVSDESAHAAPAPVPVASLLRGTGLAALLGCCLCLGFVRDGIVSWAPTILAGIGSASLGSAALSLIIPALNLLGILLVRRCYKRLRGSARGAAGAVMLFGFALTLLLRFCSGAAVCAVIMGVCCAAIYGATPMLTTYCPLEYERMGRVGLVAGLVDCFIYIGSALAGTVSGAVSDAAGWGGVYIMWAAVSVLGAFAAFLSIRGGRRLNAQ